MEGITDIDFCLQIMGWDYVRNEKEIVMQEEGDKITIDLEKKQIYFESSQKRFLLSERELDCLSLITFTLGWGGTIPEM